MGMTPQHFHTISTSCAIHVANYAHKTLNMYYVANYAHKTLYMLQSQKLDMVLV